MKKSERDMVRLTFLVRVLTAASAKGIIPKAPWAEWLTEPDPVAMAAYSTQIVQILAGPDENLMAHVADVAYRTLRLLQGRQSGLLDEAAVVGMLLRSLYDLLPYARAVIEQASLDAICTSLPTRGRVARVLGGPHDRAGRYDIDLWAPGALPYNHRSLSAPTLGYAGQIARQLWHAALVDGWPEGTRVRLTAVASPYHVEWELRQGEWVKVHCTGASPSLQRCKGAKKTV